MNLKPILTVAHDEALAMLQSQIDYPNSSERVTYEFIGPMGTGKTTLARELAAANPGHIFTEPIDLPTLQDGDQWMPALDHEARVAHQYPNARWGLSATNRLGCNDTTPLIIMVDEIGKGTKAQQTQVTPLLREWRIGSMTAPERSVIFGATNLTEEGLGDIMQGHLRNGLVQVQIKTPTCPQWVANFAIPKGLNPYVIAACKLHPEVFHCFIDYRPGGEFAGKPMNGWIQDPKEPHRACATPRSLHLCSKIMNSMPGASNHVLEAALHGAVGTFAAEIMEVKKFSTQLPDFDDVVADPQNTPLPSQATAQILCCFKLINQTKTRKHADAVTHYVKRLPRTVQILFASSCCNEKAGGVNALFATVAPFSDLCAEHKDFF